MTWVTHHESPLSRGGKRRRAALLAVIVAVHLAIILFLLTKAPARVPRPMEVGALSLIAPVADRPHPVPRSERRPATREPVRMPSPLPDKPLPLAGSPDAAVIASSTGACDLAAAAATAIEQDPAAMAELAALPSGIRSEADAVMLWNGAWLDLAPRTAFSPAVPPASALRTAIAGVVMAATPACLAADVSGPLFIAVPEVGRTTMLVLGSGLWRWGDLLASSSQCAADAAEPCAAPPPAAPAKP